MGTRGVSSDQVSGIGGITRNLSEVLTEVAEGRSELVYMG